LALIAAAVLCIPQPYHVAADVTIEPAVRSILSAPFASKLEKTHVDPGAVVTAGQTLATLDPRDLQIELAAAETEEREVSARHQEALANRQGTSSRVAKLELEQIQFKVQTLRNRMEQLAIKSSLDGVVVRGDLRRLEGAPLTAGQTLFEVAPLDDLLAEVAIPESQIEKVREGMPVDIRLDAAPYRSWPGTIAKIHPRAELRHNDSVYIAEVKLTGDIAALRPGMNGRASVTTEKHPLAWNLFHRPVASFLEFAGW
jgi:multidrug resistance efflux pump